MRKLTPEQKQKLKKVRREAYLKMKENRDNDPKYIALKEAQKKRGLSENQERSKSQKGCCKSRRTPKTRRSLIENDR